MPLDLVSKRPSEEGGDAPRAAGRREREVLHDLCVLAAQAGVEVRIEPFELSLTGKGGLCRIEGRATVLVDARLGVVDQIGVVAEALGSLGVEAPPELRPYLRTGHGAVKELVHPKPLARGRLRPLRSAR
jgi:hypothetical protein